MLGIFCVMSAFDKDLATAQWPCGRSSPENELYAPPPNLEREKVERPIEWTIRSPDNRNFSNTKIRIFGIWNWTNWLVARVLCFVHVRWPQVFHFSQRKFYELSQIDFYFFFSVENAPARWRVRFPFSSVRQPISQYTAQNPIHTTISIESNWNGLFAELSMLGHSNIMSILNLIFIGEN